MAIDNLNKTPFPYHSIDLLKLMDAAWPELSPRSPADVDQCLARGAVREVIAKLEQMAERGEVIL